jgi:hypothetical protein
MLIKTSSIYIVDFDEAKHEMDCVSSVDGQEAKGKTLAPSYRFAPCRRAGLAWTVRVVIQPAWWLARMRATLFIS